MKTKKTLEHFSLFALCSLLFALCYLSCEQPFKAGLGPIIDLQDPEIELTAPEQSTYIRGTVIFSGWAADDTQLDSVYFQISNYQPSVDEFGKEYGVDLNEWSDDYNYNIIDHKWGAFYRIPARNISGDSRKWYWWFELDTKLERDVLDAFGNPIQESDGKGGFRNKKERAFLEGAAIKIRMLVKDYLGKENPNVSSEYVFYIKNDGPQISVDNPTIRKGKEDGDLAIGGGNKLNFGYLSNVNDLKNPFQRVVYIPQKMAGTISDDEGINYTEEGWASITDADGNPQTVKLFPPQIRFWEVDPDPYIYNVPASGWTSSMPVKKNTNAGDPNKPEAWVYLKGYFPDPEDEVPWLNIYELDKDVGSLRAIDDKHAIFEYIPPDKSGKYYGFEIRAQSIDKVKSSIRYPSSYYNYLDSNLDFVPLGDKPDTSQQENSYVLVNVREPQEPLILELWGLYNFGGAIGPESWGLQDIYGKDSEIKDGGMVYKPIAYDPIKKHVIGDQEIKDRNHVYVDASPVIKNGPFILRMKATHSGGIKSAEVYWEKDDDKNFRGRFIWDPANVLPDHTPPWEGDPVPGSRHFKEWGLNEPNGNTRVRSFVFTYHHDPSLDRIPNTGFTPGPPASPNDPPIPNLQGKSKIWKLKDKLPPVKDADGNNVVFDFDKNFDLIPDGDDYWQEYTTKLPPGTYNLRVYATANSGATATPYPITIKIDERPPEINRIDIVGKAYLTGKPPNYDIQVIDNDPQHFEDAVIVNGVIRPEFQFSESDAADTGFRTGTTPYFARSTSPNTGYYSERFYILIPDTDAQKTIMDKYVKTWPAPDLSNIQDEDSLLNSLTYKYSMTLPGGETIKVSKHGPFKDSSSCSFLTSNNYTDLQPTPLELTALVDGQYRMYVFARDNAFNVTSINFPIKVEFETDRPIFDFSVGNDKQLDVTEPDSYHDFGSPGYDSANPKSFITDGKDHEAIRNKFTANTTIRVRISDDDSLDLGVGTGTGSIPSGITVKITGSETKVVNGTPVTSAKTGAAVVPLSDEFIKQAFAPQSLDKDGTTRIPVKERTGTITQRMLLETLQKSGQYDDLFTTTPVNSLPDGIYQIYIQIQDEVTAKLVENAGDSLALVKEPDRSFWIVVDNKAPDIIIHYTNTDKDGNAIYDSAGDPIKDASNKNGNPYIKDKNGNNIFDNTGKLLPDVTGETRPVGTVISTKKPEPLVGHVSDENGPISLLGWKIYDGNRSRVFSEMRDKTLYVNNTSVTSIPNGIPRLMIDRNNDDSLADNEWVGNDPNDFKYSSFENSKWRYDFSYLMDLNGANAGSFIFELKFKDRFGNESTISLRYSVDNEPPRVTLTKPIETFSRPFDDALGPSTIGNYIHIAGYEENRERLAVKVVQFSGIAQDNDNVTGIRWWLIPADKGSKKDDSAYSTDNTGGQIVDYSAYPSQLPAHTGTGTYYIPGGGAYGFIETKGNSVQFTIAVDTKKLMTPSDGEYRLHIIAIDDANNQSRVTQDSAGTPISNLFQTVFFLQEEDRPYFGEITLGTEVGSDNAFPTVDKDNKPIPVLDRKPTIRGTIWDNNGFFGRADESTYWKGSITVWFSKNGEKPTDPNWVTKVEASVPQAFTDANWLGPVTIPLTEEYSPSLGRPRIRNLSLAIDLEALFNFDLGDDGDKRYIIKATDSPVNKLWYGTTPAPPILPVPDGIPMGIGKPGYTNPTVEDENVRVSRWKQYAFKYDRLPPEVKIEAPTNGRQFGKDFKDLPPSTARDTVNDPPQNGFDKGGFNLVGYIADANLEQKKDDTDGKMKYYFEYYLDNEERKTFYLNPMTGVTSQYFNTDGTRNNTSLPATGASLPSLANNWIQGQHIYYISEDPVTKKVTVYFMIGADEVSGRNQDGSSTDKPTIISQEKFDDDDFSDGTHTLNLFTSDMAGKEGAAWVSFIKDTKPPTISFTNLTGANNSPYDYTNTSRVDGKTPAPANPVGGWWTKTAAQRQPFLLDNSATATLPLTTISYESGVPELRGIIQDIVSPIKILVDLANNSINQPGSSFRYWIDDENLNGPGRTYAKIEADTGTDLWVTSKSVRWTIYLTDTGKPETEGGIPLPDGVHTIALTAADKGDIEIPAGERYVIAFRIDSKQPKASISVDGYTETQIKQGVVFGDVDYQNTTMFTLKLEADDANLEKVELSIVKLDRQTGDPADPAKQTLTARDNPTWIYHPFNATPPLTPALTPTAPPLTTVGNPLIDDYVWYNGTYPVPSEMFKTVSSGKYEARVVAYDTAGKKSDEFVFPFSYDKTAPVIEFTNPDDSKKMKSADLIPENFIDDTSIANAANFDPTKTEFGGPPANIIINRLTSQNLRIQGNVKDDLSPIRQVQSRIEKWNWTTNKWDTATPVQDWTDVYNNPTGTQLQVSWTKNLLGQRNDTAHPDLDLDLSGRDAPAIAGTPLTAEELAAAEGLYRIQIRAKDASRTATGGNGNYDNINWTYPPAAGADMGNPVLSDYEYFYFDRNDPTLEITKINNQTTTTMATYYSNPGGAFTFEGKVKDNNRFAKVEVKFVTAGGKETIQNAGRYISTTYTPANLVPDINQGPDEQFWRAEFGSDSNTKLADGRYTVTVTVWDMVGRSNKKEMKFILDSTPPGARFTGPAKEVKEYKGYGDDTENPKPTPTAANPTVNLVDGFASIRVNGGEAAVITGETWDRPGDGGEAGSESGIDKMWFRLGFIDNNSSFPTRTAIEDDEIAKIIAFAQAATPSQTLTPAQVRAMPAGERNAWMDLIAEYRTGSGNTDARGNAWFRLGGAIRPTGFVINNPNIYDWRMEIPKTLEKITDVNDPNLADRQATKINDVDINTDLQIGGLKLYGSAITVKGRNYTVGPTAAYQMVRSVDGQAGVYRLPLWIRLVDIAGNVAYYCHDIWIYPDGDIPSTTIESPSNGTMYNARGGTISVDGVAKSNTSVYDVIFRVFADDVRDTNLDGIRTPDTSAGLPTDNRKTISLLGNGNPGTNGIVGMPKKESWIKINGYDMAEKATVDLLPARFRTGDYSTDWQKANLTLTGGSGEPIIPWSIMLSQDGGWDQLILKQGFASAGAGRDMIRIWLEVFVFNGEGAPIRCSVYPYDNLNTAGHTGAGFEFYGSGATTETPRPYVKSFYIKTGAAKISDPQVGNATNNTNTPKAHNNFAWQEYKGPGQETRNKRFGFSATLDPNPSHTAGTGLGEVSYRIKLDGGSYGTWTTAWKKGDAMPYNGPNGVYISVRDGTHNTAVARYYFDYAVDSQILANSAAFAAVNGGAWQYTGGTITVQIRMKDDSPQPNEAEQTIQVSIDNFAPVADGGNYKTNPTVAGTNVDFFGRVYDYANPVSPLQTDDLADSMNTEYTPRKLQAVYAWFTKGGNANYVNMETGKWVGQGSGAPQSPAVTQMPNVLTGRSARINGGGVNDKVDNITLFTNPPANRPPDTSRGNVPNGGTVNIPQGANVWVKELSSSTAIPGSRMLWSPVNSADYDIRWSFTLDSTLLPDGELTLHYVAVDSAGNASYYSQGPITVKNKYPEISKLTLYTYNVGIGSAYTAPAEVEYNVNDYRGKMFANYTDDTPADRAKAKTTGYLNSGFISKNNYIGFRVEAEKGNRALNFRLQHVKRELFTLNDTNLRTMLGARDTGGTNINLYTIAWHGDYSTANWKALGVHEDNPTLGTHFVLQAGMNGTNLPEDVKVSTSAQVWRYTLANIPKTSATLGQASKGPFTPTGAAQNENPADNPVVIGPEADSPGGGGINFNFKGTGATDFGSIDEYDGSHPDYDDTKDDDPDDTAFFLIRVWDSVGGTATTETEINKRLHDALVVGMNVYKTDKITPIARLYDLNPYTEADVTRNNINESAQNATVRNAAIPDGMEIGSNIVRGGLFNTGTDRDPIRSGFIDPRGGSKFLDPSNGGYYEDKSVPPKKQLVSGIQVPDYPLKVSGDSNVTGNINDQVSGKIILRGLAWDDQLINQIRISINGAAPITILELDKDENSDNYGKMKAPTAYQNSAFFVEELHWKTGHTVEWAYVWDTTNMNPDTATVQVSVVDYKNTTSGTSTNYTLAQETADAANSKIYHNGVTVNLVPYITGFVRATPTFTTKRSLQGWYSFYQNESGIRVNGYNFGNGAAPTIRINGTAMTGVTRNSTTQLTFSVPPNNGANHLTASGQIEMTTSGVDAYNNKSNTAGKSWNREYNSYTLGSELWMNRPYAHIWRSEQAEGTGTGVGAAGTIFAANNNSAGLDKPGMSLQYTGANAGRLHGVWTTYGRESLFYAQNNNTKPTVTNETGLANSTAGEGVYNNNSSSLLLIKAGEPYSDSDIDYYNPAESSPNEYTNNVSVVAAYQRDGEPYLVFKPRLSSVVFNNAGGTDGGGGDAGYYITRQDSPVSTYRWKNTRIKKAGPSTANNSPGKAFVTAYDSRYKRLFFKTLSGTLSASGSPGTNDNNGGTAYYLDGGGTLTGNIAGITAATGGAGNWSALDYDSTGRPVVAYFDEQNQTLRLAYSSSPTPDGGAAWTRRYVLPDGDPLRLGSGSYVSMKIDRDNGNQIHLAFYNSNHKAVVYAVGQTGAAYASGAFTASVIDRVVEGGQWTDISVDRDHNPWIVYADSARLGNRDGARIAYKSSGDNRYSRTLIDPISGNPITNWEALTMPANYQVKDDRLNIAVWPPTGFTGAATINRSPIGDWHAAVGYTSDQYRIGYFFKPANGMPQF
jgi:hypothetical protein